LGCWLFSGGLQRLDAGGVFAHRVLLFNQDPGFFVAACRRLNGSLRAPHERPAPHRTAPANAQQHRWIGQSERAGGVSDAFRALVARAGSGKTLMAPWEA